MNVRQLEEFIGSGDQKVFHILTVTHLYGGIAGTVCGAWLLQPFLGVWAYLLGGTLGLVSTWKRSGRPLYGWVFAYLRFVLRGLLKIGDAGVDAGQYYASHRVRSSPYMVMRADGTVVMVNRGSEANGDSLDRLIIMPVSSGGSRGTSSSALRAGIRGPTHGHRNGPETEGEGDGYTSGSGPENPAAASLPRRHDADIEAWGLN
jgi:hypothetical protein